MREMTGAKAGLSSTDQIEICLRKIVQEGGVAQMSDLYDAVNLAMSASDAVLSKSGRDGLRNYINKVAVQRGWLNKYDRSNPGWRITPRGRAHVALLNGEEPCVITLGESPLSAAVSCRV